ncbi:acyl carrier protein [Kitasatospora viridis]|uniref:Acyl carrier protein n=1 Tax=Kitasatospora viridis TaxID=281105 RepID=A0A561UJU7_9ACTN|nr:acyl carrier protein [Kitasatospora viridis]TWF99638.1 acyl carrier protein [Kitasatospora viridis]
MLSDQAVKDVLAQLLDLDETTLTPDRALAELDGWDSVNALRVLVFLERELGTSIDYERFMAAGSLGELTALVADTGTGVRP